MSAWRARFSRLPAAALRRCAANRCGTGEPTLYLISGMTGAGKTTLARRLEQEVRAIRLSPDEWLLELMQDPDDRAEMDRLRDPVERLQWSVAQDLLAHGNDVILENGFWSAQERRTYCEMARTSGFRVVLHYLDVSKSELLRRLATRNEEVPAGSLHISEAELDRWMEWLEHPTGDELDLYDDFEIHSV